MGNHLELGADWRTVLQHQHARFLPTVHGDACTGCGQYEKVRAGTTVPSRCRRCHWRSQKGLIITITIFGWLLEVAGTEQPIGKRDAGREAGSLEKKAGGWQPRSCASPLSVLRAGVLKPPSVGLVWMALTGNYWQ